MPISCRLPTGSFFFDELSHGHLPAVSYLKPESASLSRLRPCRDLLNLGDLACFSGLLSLARERIPHSSREGWFVVFTLDHILRASVVEAENLIVQVQSVGVNGKVACDLVASLGVDLVMRIEIGVATGALHTAGRQVCRSYGNYAVRSRLQILELVGKDHCVVVSHAHAQRELLGIEGRADVPSVRRLA